MNYTYEMPNNRMSADVRENIQRNVNDALKEYEEEVKGGTDLQLAAWIKKWATTATFKHLIKGLLGYLESEGLLS